MGFIPQPTIEKIHVNLTPFNYYFVSGFPDVNPPYHYYEYQLASLFYLPEQSLADYTFILYHIFLGFMSLKRIIDYMSSKNSAKKVIFVYSNKEEREKYFSSFITVLSASILIITLTLLLTRSYIPTFTVLTFSFFICLSIYRLVLSFNGFKLVEEGIINRFRLTKWNDIYAYKNISDSIDWHRNPTFKITFRVTPSVWHVSNFVQIPINSQDMDSINQILEILAERLPGKNI